MQTKISYFLVFACLFLSSQCFCQSNRIKFGSLNRAAVSVEEFVNQKELIAANGIRIDSAFVVFSIPWEGVSKVDFFPVLDSLKYNEGLQKLNTGASVSFKAFITVGDKKDSAIQVYFFLALKRQTQISTIHPSYQELNYLTGLNLKKGVIYFSGPFFRNTVKIFLPDSKALKKAVERVSPGAVVVFENVQWKDETGQIQIIDTTIKLP